MSGVDEGTNGGTEPPHAPSTSRQLETDEGDLRASLQDIARRLCGRWTRSSTGWAKDRASARPRNGGSSGRARWAARRCGRGSDAFDEHAQRLGELFAEPAAVAVHNAQVLAQAQRVVGQLQAALTSRAVIDQAIGILISRSGGTADEAFAALRAISQREQRKLADVARKLVDEAARRARARHSRP
jgi:ANTAR domain